MDSLAPRAVQIDASSHCQLACPVCPTANGLARPVLGAGHLKLSDFQRLLDDNPEIREVELSNYGEMFLNPRLPDLLACAYERKVVVSGSNGVNLNFASDAALNAVVKFRVKALTCSIDGATGETYSRYRINGNLERVLAHIDRIRELRKLSGAAFPLLDWQFVVMGHNEHEIESARAMARARGMHFFPRLSWSADHSPVVNHDLVRIQTGLGAASREEFREKKGVEYTRDICHQLWRAPVINWDGKMLGCCVNYWGDFGGNVFTDGLSASMRSPKLEYARRMLTGKAEPRPDIPCTTCDQYHAMARAEGWICEDEVQAPVSSEILVGLVPAANPSSKFARVSISRGTAAAPHSSASGTLFRFGSDTAVYFRALAGRYTAFVQYLEAAGWGRVSKRVFDLAERPLCQEVKMEAVAEPPEAMDEELCPPALQVKAVPFWIR
ncbi:MAG: SPASM domain-containing protein [Bryobacteraceae bacterium]